MSLSCLPIYLPKLRSSSPKSTTLTARMETRSRDAPPPPASIPDTPPPTPPSAVAAETLAVAADPLPRRRGAGALKRKASSSSNLSPAPKRLIKERNALNIPSLHSGPCTRARQSPNKHPSPVPPPPTASKTVDGGSGGPIGVDEDEEMVNLEEPVVDAEFDLVRSRGSDVHVVPTPAAWFSWKEIHPIEKKTLASFFSGKLDSRTPEIYMEIRNSIMKKFHGNPQTQLELKDLEEISVGESDTKQEVMEFLDHWGLINFHPFPPENQEISISDDGDDKTGSLLEKLFRFETVQPWFRSVPKKVEVSVPAAVPHFLPESSTVEELVGPEGPSVEYHCNSCSADCSRKRYHCQKQADFDLCTECYNNGKFGSGMAPSDFILMEPAELPGASSGSWTDQETLLLLEALELFQENWSEIAEHVATKTKAQCMLHFLQMPIEDPFLEGGDDADENILEQMDPSSANNSSSDGHVKNEIENVEGGTQPVSSPIDVSKSKDESEPEGSCDNGASIAVDALKAAFKAIGCLPEQEGLPSFAEAGNPVMALAAFLTNLVEPDVAMTSFRSSLKAMSEDSPCIQLATRHCFILEDPPKDKEDPPVPESAVTDVHNGEAAREEDKVPISNVSDESKDCTVTNVETSVPVENDKNPPVEINKNRPVENEKNPLTENKESPSAENENSPTVENGKSPSVEKENVPSVPLQDPLEKPSNAKELGESISPQEATPNCTKESGSPTLPEDQIVVNDLKNGSDSASPTVVSSTNPEDPGGAALPKEAASTNEINELEPADEDKFNTVKQSGHLASINVVEQISNTSMAVDMKPPSEEQEINHKASIGATLESTEIADEDGRKESPGNNGKGSNSTETNDAQKHQKINKLKRAAVTVLSTAAVKAKLLANQEEDQIRQLVSLVIEKQLHKLETKLALFTDIESVIMRMREQTERARHRLIHERAQIIAARLGLSASSARANPPLLPPNKFPTGYGSMSMNPPLTIASQKPPPMRRP